MAIGINGKSQTEQTNQSDFVDDLTKETEEQKDSDTLAKKLGIIAAVVIVVIVLCYIIIPKLTKPKQEDSVVIENDYSEYVDGSIVNEDLDNDTVENAANSSTTNDFVTGDPVFNTDQNQTTNTLVNSDEYVMNLQGETVPVSYVVNNRKYVKTHVNYVAKRAVIDDGMEMYWLDITYKGKKYRAQVPFYYFKDLDSEGICRVEIEILNLENGGQIISYMQIIEEDDGTD